MNNVPSRSNFASTGRLTDRQSWPVRLTCLCMLALISTPAFSLDETAVLNPPTQDSVSADSVETPAEHRVEWLHSFDEALATSATRRAPVLVIFGAVWCGPCRLLEKEIEDPAVQNELERWVPLHLDVDEDPDTASRMAVSSIPALRVVTPDGRVVGQQTGMMEAADLVTWLSEQYHMTDATATGARPTATLTSVTVKAVLRDFASRESTTRETAISRIVLVPQLAAAHVIAGFGTASLSEQLAIIDVLSAWEAPLEGLDPWIPDSITEERLSMLEDWVSTKEFAGQTDSFELSAAEVIEATRLLRRLQTAEPAEAAACREQLARIGPAVLPMIREAMQEALDDEARSHLSQARYRVAASVDLASEWPDGIARLASSDFRQRVAAVHELSNRVRVSDEALLAELFKDPTPLIREISLGALKRIGGTRVDGPLVKMLKDPDPNVKAAVLKHLADAKSESLIQPITEFIQNESDMDLIVHAVRCLREIGSLKSTQAMLPLTDHTSWRVRAEAVEGVNKFFDEASHSSSTTIPASVKTLASTAFLKRLDDEDGFVVGKVAEGLKRIRTSDNEKQTALLTALDRALVRHPDLAIVIVSNASHLDWPNYDFDEKLRQYCRHESSAIRAAAISRLVPMENERAFEEIKITLHDEESIVRVASMNALALEIHRLVLDTTKREIQELAASMRKAEPTSAGSSADDPTAANDSVADAADTAVEDVADVLTAEKEATGQNTLLGFIGGLFGVATSGRDDYGGRSESSAGNGPDAAQHTAQQADQVFADIIQGRKLSQGIYQFEEVLKQYLQDGSADEKFAAARCLAMLGDSDALTFVMLSANFRTNLESLAMLLPALPWNERLELFRGLMRSGSSSEDRAHVAEQLAVSSDPRGTEELWNILAGATTAGKDAVMMFTALRTSYPGGSAYARELNEVTKESMNSDGMEKAANGENWQRVLGLAMMSWTENSELNEVAKTLVVDASQAAEIRSAALEILFLRMDENEAQQFAVSLLADPEPQIAELALRFLSLGTDAGFPVAEGLRVSSLENSFYSGSNDTPAPVILRAPTGLTIENVTPFLQSPRTDVVACSSHLLALMNDFRGLPLLVDHWRAEPSDRGSQKMLYQAITMANDPAYVPILEEMYFQKSNVSWYSSNMADFYWTIRNLSGPEILALRKKIRDEQGAQVLRQRNY